VNSIAVSTQTAATQLQIRVFQPLPASFWPSQRSENLPLALTCPLLSSGVLTELWRAHSGEPPPELDDSEAECVWRR
jgi:hypothetical protein